MELNPAYFQFEDGGNKTMRRISHTSSRSPTSFNSVLRDTLATYDSFISPPASSAANSPRSKSPEIDIYYIRDSPDFLNGDVSSDTPSTPPTPQLILSDLKNRPLRIGMFRDQILRFSQTDQASRVRKKKNK